jgi:hypothetical protein
MLGVLLAMALAPELSSQLWFSLMALAIVVIAYFVVRRPRAVSETAAQPQQH